MCNTTPFDNSISIKRISETKNPTNQQIKQASNNCNNKAMSKPTTTTETNILSKQTKDIINSNDKYKTEKTIMIKQSEIR